MLHSTLPRAFLPPVLQGYAAGYCVDEGHHLYSTAASYVPCIDDPYARIHERHVDVRSWETTARPASPSPLDLSVKPSQNKDPSRPDDVDEIEVDDDDDDDDRKFRIAIQGRTIAAKRSYSDYEEPVSMIEETECGNRRSESVHSYRSHEDVSTRKEIPDHQSFAESRMLQQEILRNHQIHSYNNYEATSTKREAIDPRDLDHRKINLFQDHVSALAERQKSYQPLSTPQKLLLASSNNLRSPNYHPQLPITPQHHLQGIHAPMTPPSTPSPPQCPRRRNREESDIATPHALASSSNVTPNKQSACHSEKLIQRPKKKHARRLKFDEDTSSPVSGTVILGPDEAVVTGDIDPAFNIVEVTEEARAELAKIENRLGPYQCKLCRQLHDDAFQLAQHRCSRIAHVEYRCPECDKRFSCPANLASHRRWHKPRIPNGENTNVGTAMTNTSGTATGRDTEISCNRCEAKFTRTAALRKHLASQHPEANNNVFMTNNNNDDNNTGFDEINNSLLGKPLCIAGTGHLGNASFDNEIP